jgi:hypothetical protein
MTIKQYGGVFGRNPTFNDVTIEGQLTFDGDIDVNSDLKVTGDVEASKFIATTSGYTVNPAKPIFGLFGTAGFVQAPAGGEVQIWADSTSSIATFKDNMDVSINTGNLVIGTSGKGIDFSATAGTGTSELFDDYEEGYVTGITMTPSTSGTITMLAAYTTLSYTKVGRIVTITGNLVTSSSSSPVGTSVAIGTLPFTVAAGDQTAFAAGNAVTYYEGGGVYSSTPIRVTENATTITWLIDASTVSGVKELYINLSYVAA